jgi:PBSX family phage terminase large subunit
MQDAGRGKCTNAAVFRKVGNTLRDSVYEQIEWAIDALGVQDLWESSLSPLQHVYKPTGQKILYRGLDKAKKTKSVKTAKGYIKYLWFEELDEFSGIEEIRTTQQSVLRGGSQFVVFKTFNPPISLSNWANKYVAEPRSDSYRHKSDYRSVPAEWLGEQFINDAEHLKTTNEKAYKHEYLGEPVGLGTNVFEFIDIRTITNEEYKEFDRIYQGCDWGFYPDPYAFIRLHYDHARDTLYLLDEHYCNKQSNAKTGKWILNKKYDDYIVTCDSAEPKSINDYKDMGIPANGVQKGPGSVEYSMKWLQSRHIVIDSHRTPNAYKEFIEYEFEVNDNGDIISKYPDKNNHAIDAVRYATYPLWRKRGCSA